MIRLRFSTQPGIASRLIRWGTWSPFSHVDFVMPDGRVLGATASAGVAIRDAEPAQHEAIFNVPGVPGDVVFSIAAGQLGRPYDWAGVLGFALRRRWHDHHAWFCSELVAWAFWEAGVPLLRTDAAWRVTPRDLLLSPRLQPAPS